MGWRKTWIRRAAFPLLALLAHGLAFSGLLLLPVRRVVLPPPPRGPDETSIDVTFVASADAPAEEPQAMKPLMRVTAERVPLAGSGGSRITAAKTTPPEPDARAAEGSESPPAAVPAREPVALVTPVKPATIDIGLGGTNRFLPRSADAVERAESQRAVDRSLRDAAREREQTLGLGPEGPVLSALADGTSRSVAPVRGRAVFVATSNAAGEVVSIELEDAEGGRPGWADAARIALASLQGKKLHLAPGTTRAVMKIEVVSAWKLPSGQDPGSDVTLFHIPVAKGEGKDSAKVSILDPIPKVRVDHYEVSPGVKIPLLSIQLDVFSATTDPSNLGAKPRRVIHSRLLDSKLM